MEINLPLNVLLTIINNGRTVIKIVIGTLC